MSSTIDERVVAMRFDNSDFDKNIKQTQNSLQGLENSLKLDGVASGVQSIASKFSAFGAIAFTALQNLTNSAIGFGKNIAGAVLDPLIEGGKKRALNIEQAMFQFEGLGMNVESTMDSALKAVQGTAFGLDEAAVAASQFGASGIEAGDDMTNALRGISGVAAMAGSSYSDIADVFTKVAGQGRLMGEDLNRLGARGINAAATLGEAFDKSEGEIRDLVSKGEISFQDFSKAMSEAFGEHATKANETYTGSLSNMRAALARIGAAFAGDWFKKQRDLFNSITPAIDGVAEAIQPLVDWFNKLNATRVDNIRTVLDALTYKGKDGNRVPDIFKAINNSITAFVDIAKQVQAAWFEIFPPTTDAQAKSMAKAIAEFTEKLKLSEDQLANVKSTFKGFFAILDIGWMVIKGVAGVLGRLFSTLMGGSGAFLEMSGSVGDWLVGVRDAIKEGNVLQSVFKTIGDVLVKPVEWLRRLGSYISDLTGIDSFASAWDGVARALQKVGEFLAPVGEWFVNTFRTIKDAVRQAFETMDFNILLGLLNTGILGGVGTLIYKFVKKIPEMLSGVGGGIFDTIKGAFEQLTSTLEAMQTKLKAEALIKIAIAVGILAAAVVGLSMIDPARLYSALGGIAVMMGTLTGMIAALEKITKDVNGMKLNAVATSLVLLGGAILIMSFAVKKLSGIGWEELAQGLSAIAVGLGLLIGAVAVMQKFDGQMVKAGFSMILLSTGLLILSSAIKSAADLQWDEMARGMSVLAGGIGIMVGAMSLMNMLKGSLVKGAIALGILSIALQGLSSGLKGFTDISWDEMGRGLVAMAGSLAIVALAIGLLPPSSLLSAAALLVVSFALGSIADAMNKFAGFEWDEIGRGLTMLVGTLGILAIGLTLMIAALPGALALVVVAAGLNALVPVLTALAGMSWAEVGQGLGMLAATLGVVALAGILLLPAIPGLMGLGAAIALIGVGVLAAGAGLGLLALGITAIAAAGDGAAVSLKNFLITIAQAIPEIAIEVANGLTNFVVTLANNAGKFTDAMAKLMMALLDAINQVAPKIIDTLANLLMKLFDRIVEDVPKFVDGGMRLITGILNGIADNIGKIIDAGTRIVTEFLAGLGESLPDIIQAGFDLILDFVTGLTDSIRENSSTLGTAGGDLAVALIEGMVNGIGAGVDRIVDAARNMASAAFNAAKDFLGIHSPSRKFKELGKYVVQGFAIGIRGEESSIRKEFDTFRKNLQKTRADLTKDIQKHNKNIAKMRKAQAKAEKQLDVLARERHRLRMQGKSDKQVLARMKKLTDEKWKNIRGIRAEQKEVRKLQNERKRAAAVQKQLNDKYKKQQWEQIKLERERVRITDRLDKAQQDYADKLSELKQFSRSTADSLRKLPTISEDLQLEDYISQMKTQYSKMKELQRKLQELRNWGLNDETYKDILAMGTDALPFIDQIIASGAEGIKDLNKIATGIRVTGGVMGLESANSLYRAGVDAAEGLVKGLESQLDKIEKSMEKIANAMVKAIKKQLGIKSPSRELAKVGEFANEGLIRGLEDTTRKVEVATTKVGDGVVEQMRKSIDDISKSVASDMVAQPTIRPIVDLTSVNDAERRVSRFNDSLRNRWGGRALQAELAQKAYQTRSLAQTQQDRGTTKSEVNYTQNNYSPKALSPAEIYRQTRNQLSTKKEELTTNA